MRVDQRKPEERGFGESPRGNTTGKQQARIVHTFERQINQLYDNLCAISS